MIDILIAKKYVNKIQSSSDRNIEFNLSFVEYKRLTTRKKCFYTGKTMNQTEGSKFQLTLDRIDASKGYTKENTVACCSYINTKKKDLTIKEIEQIYKKITSKELK